MAEIKKGKMTLDKLAGMMVRRFDEVEGRIDGMEAKIATKEDLHIEISRLDQRLAKLEFKLDELRDMINHLEEVDILDLQKRVKELEQEVKQFKKQAGFK